MQLLRESAFQNKLYLAACHTAREILLPRDSRASSKYSRSLFHECGMKEKRLEMSVLGLSLVDKQVGLKGYCGTSQFSFLLHTCSLLSHWTGTFLYFMSMHQVDGCPGEETGIPSHLTLRLKSKLAFHSNTAGKCTLTPCLSC